MEEFVALKEGVDKMKVRYMNLPLDRDNILMVAEMHHSALKKEEEESDRLTHELEITSNSLTSTQRLLQE